MQAPMPLYYTRCPVPTASGIAFQRGMFAELFRESGYEVRALNELGPQCRDVHYTHAIETFFREGGGAPPVWARANAVDSVVLGITFMEELLGVFVRADDPAGSVADLAGRRLALPVWPRLVFNFWRFAALKGLHSALAVHGLRDEDVEFVDIVEDWDPHERSNVGRSELDQPARCEYRNQLEALSGGGRRRDFRQGTRSRPSPARGGRAHSPPVRPSRGERPRGPCQQLDASSAHHQPSPRRPPLRRGRALRANPDSRGPMGRGERHRSKAVDRAGMQCRAGRDGDLPGIRLCREIPAEIERRPGGSTRRS